MFQGQYIHYHPGSENARVLIEALHAKGPGADLYTGELVEALHEQANVGAIISDVSRESMDLNRPRSKSNQPAIDEYREVISNIFEDRRLLDAFGHLTVPFLQISIHGMQDSWNRDIEIGTGYGHYCDPEVKHWIQTFFSKTDLNTGIDDLFPGYTFRSVLREGDIYGQTCFMGFGPAFQTLQIEISQRLRTHHFQWLVEKFTELTREFETTFLPQKTIPRQAVKQQT